MGFFSEQIKERKQNDELALQDAYENMDTAITGKHHSTSNQNGATDVERLYQEILSFFRKKDIIEQHDFKEPFDDTMESTLLGKGVLMWSEDFTINPPSGNVLVAMKYKDNNNWCLLYPGKISGYTFYDTKTGVKTKLNKNNQDLFDSVGYLLTYAFPMRAINIVDLILFIQKIIRKRDRYALYAITFIITLLGMLIPRLTYFGYSTVIEQKSISLLLSTALFLLLAGVGSALFTAVKQMITTYLGSEVNLQVQAATMARIFSLPPSFFRNHSAGELAKKIFSIRDICSSLVITIFSVSVSSIFSLLYITQLFQYAPKVAAPALVMLAISVGFTIIVIFIQRKITIQKLEISAKNEGLKYALVNGIQKIRLSGSENRVFAKWANAYAKELELDYRPPFIIHHSKDISVTIQTIGQVILYYYAMKSNLSPASYSAFISAYAVVSSALISLTGIASSIAGIEPILQSIKPIMDAIPDDNATRRAVKRLNGNIEMSHIKFRYEENSPYIFNDFSLKIKKGEYIGIVGKSGCGKSTLVRLLLGFETPENGAIYYDGQDISKLDVHSLRRNIGTVMQDGKLFQGDILSNITIASPLATEEEAWKAAELSGIAEDIRKMPMGMQTMITEGGGSISGGQRQRLLIARAVVGKPKVLIFDEATSALDNNTQKLVSEALDTLSCTRIVIAHRLSTIQQCNRILYLENGKIVEEGTYDELLEKNGKFSDLVKRQIIHSNVL